MNVYPPNIQPVTLAIRSGIISERQLTFIVSSEAANICWLLITRGVRFEQLFPEAEVSVVKLLSMADIRNELKRQSEFSGQGIPPPEWYVDEMQKGPREWSPDPYEAPAQHLTKGKAKPTKRTKRAVLTNKAEKNRKRKEQHQGKNRKKPGKVRTLSYNTGPSFEWYLRQKAPIRSVNPYFADRGPRR